MIQVHPQVRSGIEGDIRSGPIPPITLLFLDDQESLMRVVPPISFLEVRLLAAYRFPALP